MDIDIHLNYNALLGFCQGIIINGSKFLKHQKELVKYDQITYL